MTTTQKPSNFTVNLADLTKILEQIKIAEVHASTGVLANLNGTPINPLLPAGLRTVDGSYNSLLPGQTLAGAADQVMPRALAPSFLNEMDGDQITLGPPGSGAPTITNTNYDSHQSVVDADPRIISNLISDQTLNNFSALFKALELAGSSDPFSDAAAIASAADPVAMAASMGLDVSEKGQLTIENLSPDIGLSPSFNGWMTLFGQFFDHGLDLIPKSGNGTVYIPLEPDDPLYIPGGQNFMALTRAATVTLPGADGVLGTADDVATHETINTTTPFIDQNQTYTSHASHQVFLREYQVLGGKPVATGHLLDGANGGIANWAEIKTQARDLLGIELGDFDIHNVPLLRTDPYGKFIPANNGLPQLITGAGADGLINTADDQVVIGNLSSPVSPAGVNALRTGHAFLDDIAHHAAPGYYDHDHNPNTAKIAQVADADNALGDDGLASTYDNEMLDRHFITGDGRGNENIGLTAVHTVFHAEHNRLVEDYKHTILGSADLATINEWLLTDLTSIAQIPTTQAGIDALNWDGERLFQAGRFVTEMQYQHLVFEEFGRSIQPAIDPFVFSASPDLDPAIVAEFAHVVYRFGHSMLRETVDRLDPSNQVVSSLTAASPEQIGLIEAFLNPIEFDQDGAVSAAEAAGQIVRGMSRQVGNEIDEFLTEALRNNLVGLPLDLGALNIARGRETGMPSLNEARAQFYEATGDSRLSPYANWVDFTTNIKNPMSVINFIAAYGTHSTIVSATTTQDRYDAAWNLVVGGNQAPADRLDYLNGTGPYWSTHETGLNKIDFWIGGLAEAKQEFGGMLGSTFNFVFETQMETLQNSDRFYYLSRTQGMNLLNELEANSFANIVMRNTDLGNVGQGHLPGDLFFTPDRILEINKAVQIGNDPSHGNPIMDIIRPLFIRRDTDNDGDSDMLQYNGGEHVVLGGSEEADTLVGGLGIDALWGDGGNDRLDGGYEADKVHGGDGDDIITNLGGDDFLFGENGNDVISLGSGLVLAFGGLGKDFVVTGPDGQEVFAGQGDDFVLGGVGADVLMGNEGNDWLEGGEGFDALTGENSELFFNSPIIGHDVMNGQGNDTDYDGESGDDIMVQGAGIQRNNGMFGFDWAIHKGDSVAANSDLGIPIFSTSPDFTLRDRFDSIEGLSGWNLNDTLTGQSRLVLGANPQTPVDQNHLLAGNVGLISGLAQLLGHTDAYIASLAPTTAVFIPNNVVETPEGGAEIIIGGGGSDTIRGNLGNDLLDGDAWLNVRIRVTFQQGQANTQANEWFTVDSMNDLRSRMLTGEINPGQLHIVREILYPSTSSTDVDVAVYGGNQADYTVTRNANSTFTVTDNRDPATIANHDGIDTIRNIEFLRFADGDLNIGNAAPVITSNGGAASASVQIAENTVAVTTVTASDSDLPAQVLSYSISGADAALFSINASTGTLQFLAAPNFEAPADNGSDNTYQVTVTVTDGIASDSQNLAVSVSNVNEALTGSVNITGYTTSNTSATLTASNTLSDPDGMSNFVQYQWQTQAANGNWSNIAGANAASLANQSGTVVRVTSSYTDAFGNYSLISPETAFITGTNASNVRIGGAGVDYVLGLGGQDELTGGGGADVVDGGTGNDTLLASIGDGNDRYIGGTGTDSYDVHNTTAALTADLTAGTATSAQTGSDTLVEIENLQGGSGADWFRDNSVANQFWGGGGADTFVMTNDGQRDTLNGEGGSDTADYSALTANLTVSFALLGQTTVTGSGSNANTDRFSGIENFIGGTGNDTITGDSGANALNGGGGNDRITGGGAADQLTGGLGNDTFVFSGLNLVLISTYDTGNTAATRDVVTDFVAGQDRLDFSGIDANSSNLTNQAFTWKANAGEAFTGAAQLRHRFEFVGAQEYTIVEGNVNNSPGTSEFQVALVGHHNLTANDIIL